MLKTLDVLIGATTIILLFSMAVTVITQALTTFFSKARAAPERRPRRSSSTIRNSNPSVRPGHC